MATTHDRNPDETAKAARVIRILHENHAAASDYLHKLHDASHMSRMDFRLYLRHSPLDEYLELVEPLDKGQKAALFEIVARMKDRTPASPIDKETTKTFFQLLELKDKGLSFKNVRKEVKKTPPSVDHAIASPVMSTPQPEASTKKKRKRMEDATASQSSPRVVETTLNPERQSKKQKTQTTSVQPPPESPAKPILSRNQRRREKRKARLAAAQTSTANVETSTPAVQNTVKGSTQPKSSGVSYSDAASRAEPKLLARSGSNAAVSVPNVAPTNETESTALPEQKKKHKTRRSRRKPKMASLKQPDFGAASASSLTQKEVDLSTDVPNHEHLAPENASLSHLQHFDPPLHAGDVPLPFSHQPLAQQADPEISVSSSYHHSQIHGDEVALSSPLESLANETIMLASPSQASPEQDVDGSRSTSESENPAEDVASSSPSRQSPAQEITAPVILPGSESSELEAGGSPSSSDQDSPAQDPDLPMSSLGCESPAQVDNLAMHSPEHAPLKQDAKSPASSHHESPTPKPRIPMSITRTALPLTTKPVITTTIERAPDHPVTTQVLNSPRPGSSSEFDLRAGPLAFSMPEVASRTERQPVALPSPSRNDTSRSIPSVFGRAQGSRSPTRASPFSARQRVIPSASTTTDDSSFRNFSRFISGKKPGEDDSSSDDESSSSSSSSDDEADARPIRGPARTAQAFESEARKEESAAEITPMSAPISNDQDGESQDENTVSQDLPRKEEQHDTAVTEVPALEVNHKLDAHPDEDLEMADQPIDESGPSIEDAGSQEFGRPVGVLEHSIAPTPTGSQEHALCRITSPSPVRDERVKSSSQRTDKADPVTFTSFHENPSPQDAPSPTPMPEILDLMDFGGYRPLYENDNASSVLPGYSNTAASVIDPAIEDNDDVQEMEEDDDEIVVRPVEISEHSNSPNYVSEPGPTIQTSNPSSPIQVNDSEPEDAQGEEALRIARLRSSSPVRFSSSDETTEEQARLLDGFRGVFEQSEEQFSTRMASLRNRLELGTDGTVEGRKAVFKELLEEITHEEAVHESKLSAARRAVGRDVPEAKERMFRIIDHAGEKFEQTISSTRTALQEEYEHISGSQLPKILNDDIQNTDVMVLIESPSKNFRAQFPNSSLASEQAYEATFADTEADEINPTSDAPEKAESISNYEEESPMRQPQKKKRKTTGLRSPHFVTPSPAKKRRVPAGTSAVPFPKLSAPRFGLIQEELAGDPFRLLIAVTFLNKTSGKVAVPIYRQLMELYPTPSDLAAASVPEVSELIRPLGLQNQRAKKLVRLAQTWVDEPPQKGTRHRTRDYPVHGDGRDLKPSETVEDAENCAGALEIGHMYGLGPYAYDSWRIFCRDVLRGVAKGYNGQGVPGYNSTDATSQSVFEPEWKRVVPLDKELRACLRWMWLREGWEWDPLTGKKKVANVQLVREASNGDATWDEPDGTPKEESSVGGSATSKTLKVEENSPELAKISPETPEAPPSPPTTRRATRSSTRLKMSLRSSAAAVKPSPEL